MISKNRQSINSDDQFEDNTNEFDENSNESNDFDNQSDQQFPPRNAQRRQRRRNQATKNRKFGNQNSDSNANGSLDDRHDEDSFNELQHNQQENHLDNEPIHKDDKLSSEKTLIMMLHVEIIVMKHQINMIKTMIMVV